MINAASTDTKSGLEGLIKGDIVIVSNSRTNTGVAFMPSGITNHCLFLSDGSFDVKRNSFGVLGGAYGLSACAHLYENGNYYISLAKSIELQKSCLNFIEQYNEGTFSRDGPSRWTSMHSSGGSFEVFNDKEAALDYLSRGFKGVPANEVIESLIFCNNSFHFELPSFYLDIDSYNNANLNQMITLNAVHKLFDKAGFEIFSNDKAFNRYFLGSTVSKLDGKKIKEYISYHLNINDYFLWGTGMFAFVKVGCGEAYVMPFKENYGGKMADVAKKACNPDFIKQFFPQNF
jgi:hypothetical protein